jgi:hypothetical protein
MPHTGSEGMTSIDYLQVWYRAQCNGEWEHRYGVSIESLDNPGWGIRIDLAQTPLQDRAMEPIRQERSDTDWWTCEVVHNQFIGHGDASKLAQILAAFQSWSANAT